MKNPIGNVSVYRVTGKLYNPYLKSDWSMAIVPITWSKQRVARAWWGYSDHCMATAGGYGYDKESTVLAQAVAILCGHNDVRKAEGVGVERVIELASTHDVLVEKLV